MTLKEQNRIRADRRHARRNEAQLGKWARGRVHIAVKRGELPQLDGSIACVDCDGPAEVYDHRDYQKPLEVEPVCRPCNHDRGSATPHKGYQI